MNTPQPIKNKILGQIIEQKPTNGGLILLDEDLNKHEVKVLAIGPLVNHVKVGDTVRFDPYSAVDYEYDGKKCVFFNEEGTIFIK